MSYFLTIIEEGSITKAADKLHLSQQLKLLEDELEVKSVERVSRKLQVTEAGTMLTIQSQTNVGLK